MKAKHLAGCEPTISRVFLCRNVLHHCYNRCHLLKDLVRVAEKSVYLCAPPIDR